MRVVSSCLCLCLQLLQDEVAVMDEIITNSERPRAYDYCRRGAILRKLGRIEAAMSDLTRAIDMEPSMLDAYWHRHLIHLLLNRKQQAMDDLSIIIKINKNHAEAYKSRSVWLTSILGVTLPSLISYGGSL